MRFRIRAWGSAEFPDLDYEDDTYPRDLGWKYPAISIACMTPISLEAIRSALEDRDHLKIRP